MIPRNIFEYLLSHDGYLFKFLDLDSNSFEMLEKRELKMKIFGFWRIFMQTRSLILENLNGTSSSIHPKRECLKIRGGEINQKDGQPRLPKKHMFQTIIFPRNLHPESCSHTILMRLPFS